MSTGYKSNYPTSGYASETQLRNEFQKIQDALEDTISRTGKGLDEGQSNSMHADLDLNSNDVFGVRALDSEEIRTQVLTIGGVGIQILVDEATTQAGRAEQEADRSKQEADRSKQEADRAEHAAEDFRTGPYSFLGDYGPGLVATHYTQVVRDSDGEFWRVSGQVDLPYTTTGTGLPEGDAFVPAGDAVLRQDLSDPDKGAAIISYRDINVLEALDAGIQTIATVDDLRQTEPLHIGQVVYVREFYLGHGYGGGFYEAVDSTYSGSDSEETLGSARWRMVVEGNVFPIDRLGAVKDDAVSVKDAFIRAIECVSEAGSGTVYVGPGEWTMASVYYEVNTSNITFHFDLGCRFKMEYVLLGWYPTAPGKGYSNVSIVGKGVIEALPGTMWHNDFVYVDGIELRDLTFIRPVYAGHFLDLNGCTNVTIDGITVLGSNVERPNDPRLFTEFIQTAADGSLGLGWPAKRTEYEPLMHQGIGTSNVSLTNSVFIPYTDDDGTTYPPRPIGNHGAVSTVRNLRIVGNEFKDVIRQDIADRTAWLEIPTVDGVHIRGNSFVCTSAAAGGLTGTIRIIELLGSVSSGGVTILDNTFDITRSDGEYAVAINSRASGASVSVTGNVFKCAAEFSDLISLSAPCNIKVLGNSVDSTGRRFLFASESGAGSSCLVQGNDLFFNPVTQEDYRFPVHCSRGDLNIIGNRIDHPSMAIRASEGAVCTAAGNTLVGGATSVSITQGVLTGNVFNTTASPVVTIGGAAQTSQGWDFVHIPA